MSTSNPKAEPLLESRTSERFRAADADVIFKSQDHVLFRLHRKNLEYTCGGFPPGEFSTMGEEVQLTETAATLELLFSFVYPQRYPSLIGIEFDTLILLTEAAEKYEVYPAMNICHVRMREHIQEHPIDVLNYSTRHGYPDIVNEAALLTIEIPLRKIAISINGQILPTWLRYYDLWMGIIEGRDEPTIYREELHHWTEERSTGGPLSFCPEITKAVEGLSVTKFLKVKLIRELRGNMTEVRPCMEACQFIGEKYKRVLEGNMETIPAFDDLLKGVA